MMPQDVLTCWNSTFNMLEFAIRYRVAIDAMTAAREFNLRKYELASVTGEACAITYTSKYTHKSSGARPKA